MLTVRDASVIVDAAIAAGRERELKPLTVAVLDVGGHLVALKREDGSGFLRIDVAIGKAYGAIGIGISSRALGVAAIERPHFWNGTRRRCRRPPHPRTGRSSCSDFERVDHRRRSHQWRQL